MHAGQSGRWRIACLALVLLISTAVSAFALERAFWIRYPAISPDGRTVVFSYQAATSGRCPSTGGVATPLTVGESLQHHARVVARRLAASRSRRTVTATLDVYVMPAEGGESTRLTFHSADETPTSFTPDGKAVLFTASILDAPSNVLFPNSAQPELYRVSLDGGMPVAGAHHAGDLRDVTTERESVSRTRTSPDSRWNGASTITPRSRARCGSTTSPRNRHTRLTAFGADNRQPVWGPDDQSLYYLSEAQRHVQRVADEPGRRIAPGAGHERTR